METECLWFGRLDTKLIQERKVIKNEKRCRNGIQKSTWTRKDKSDSK